jgi:hypothetical protein
VQFSSSDVCMWTNTHEKISTINIAPSHRQQGVDINLSTSWEQEVWIHPDDKLLN